MVVKIFSMPKKHCLVSEKRLKFSLFPSVNCPCFGSWGNIPVVCQWVSCGWEWWRAIVRNSAEVKANGPAGGWRIGPWWPQFWPLPFAHLCDWQVRERQIFDYARRVFRMILWALGFKVRSYLGGAAPVRGAQNWLILGDWGSHPSWTRLLELLQ